ncbi:MAG: hypothetical protein ACR5LD_10620 [Symbiopectobacterium sp.]
MSLADSRASLKSLNYTPAALLDTLDKRISRYQADMLGRTAKQPENQKEIKNLVYVGRLGK